MIANYYPYVYNLKVGNFWIIVKPFLIKKIRMRFKLAVVLTNGCVIVGM